MSDPVVTKYMNIESFKNENQAKEMILLFDKLSEKKEAIRYSIIELKSNKIIGSCGFNYIDFNNAKAEIGYDLNKTFWGQGFAKEAITCLLQYAFNDLRLNRIEAKIEPRNMSSIKLIERLDFTYEGTLRQTEKSKNKFIDLSMYSILASDK
jgi:ribosomal-protein-alanine N-acetyltransferase